MDQGDVKKGFTLHTVEQRQVTWGTTDCWELTSKKETGQTLFLLSKV